MTVSVRLYTALAGAKKLENSGINKVIGMYPLETTSGFGSFCVHPLGCDDIFHGKD